MHTSKYRPASIIWLGLSVSLLFGAQHVYTPMLPIRARQLGAPLSLVGLIVAVYAVPQVLLRIPIGVASDLWGRRKPFVVAGFVLSAVGGLGLALSPSPGLLAVFRAIAGVGSCTWVALSTYLVNCFPADQALHATGVMAFFQSGGMIAAAALGALVSGAFGLRAPFLASVVLAGGGLLALSQTPREAVESRTPLSLAQLRSTLTEPMLLLTSGAGLVAFYANWATTNSFVPIYAQKLGASAAAVGWLATGTQVAYALSAIQTGRLGRRWRPFQRVSVAFVALSALDALAPAIGSVPLFALSRAAYGACYGQIYPVLMGQSIAAVPEQKRASAMSVFQAIYAVGMFLGPATSGLLADRFDVGGAFRVAASLSLATALALQVILRTWRSART